VCSARSGAAGHVTVTIARASVRAATAPLHGEFAPCVAVDVDLRSYTIGIKPPF